MWPAEVQGWQRQSLGESKMSHAHSVWSGGPAVPETLTLAQKEMLERAVAKLVLVGEQVGVSADQMILLLESGLTVRELLEYLAARDVGIV
jgi:hypothetical protein